MRITRSAFEDGGNIDRRYWSARAGGDDMSPTIEWDGAPEGTRSYAISMVDHAPVANLWVHWLAIDIPAATRMLPDGASGVTMPQGTKELHNTAGSSGYGGPSPPPGSGDHPYVLTVYALSVDRLSLSSRASLDDFERAIAGVTLDSASITGHAQR